MSNILFLSKIKYSPLPNNQNKKPDKQLGFNSQKLTTFDKAFAK